MLYVYSSKRLVLFIKWFRGFKYQAKRIKEIALAWKLRKIVTHGYGKIFATRLTSLSSLPSIYIVSQTKKSANLDDWINCRKIWKLSQTIPLLSEVIIFGILL